MNFWSTLKGWFGGDGAKNRVYLVDAAASGRDMSAPRSQIDLLQRLSRFAGKEKLKIHVCIDGTPLRQAPDSAPYRDVLVHYTGNKRSSADLVAALCGKWSRNHEVVVVTDHAELEKEVLRRGGRPMRGNTFRKALEMSFGGGDERSSQPRGQQRGRSARRRGSRKSGREPKEKLQKDRASNANATKPADPIKEMIDLVE